MIRELIEATGRGRPKFTMFDLMVDGSTVYSNENADRIDSKLKTSKFSKIDKKKLSVLRTDQDGTEDVTKLFIK